MMPDVQRGRELDIDEDIGYQRRSWTAQRVGQAVMALVLLAALAGLLGPGPLSDATARDPGGAALQVEYNRFWRSKSSLTLRAHLGPGAVREGKARVWLSRAYAQDLQIQEVKPEPDSVEIGAERLTYVFSFSTPDGAPAATVTFIGEPEKAGTLRGRMGLENGPTLDFRQFVYP